MNTGNLRISLLKHFMNGVLIASLTFLIYSCKGSLVESRFDRDTEEIYSLSLAHTTGSDTSFRYHILMPPSPLELYGDKINKEEQLKYEQRKDSLKAIVDTLNLFVVVNHKIDTLPVSEIQKILGKITYRQEILENKMDGDTSFNETLRVLCNNELSFDTIDVLNLTAKFNYAIYSDKAFSDDECRQIGTVSFSKVAFSKSKSKAAVYTSFVCGRLCGTGQILFFEKLNGIWKLIKTWEMWVS